MSEMSRALQGTPVHTDLQPIAMVVVIRETSFLLTWYPVLQFYTGMLHSHINW